MPHLKVKELFNSLNEVLEQDQLHVKSNSEVAAFCNGASEMLQELCRQNFITKRQNDTAQKELFDLCYRNMRNKEESGQTVKS